MKRWLIPLMILSLALSACSTPGETDDNKEESLNPNARREGYDFVNNQGHTPRTDRYDEIGFSRQQGNKGSNTGQNDVYFSRSALAKQISNLSTRLPQVDDATVVVTDDKVLIGVKSGKGKVSDKILHEVRRTAWSLTPRYYRVYVTGDPEVRNQLNRIGKGSQQHIRMTDDRMEGLVERMKRGNPMNKHIPDHPSPGTVDNRND
ncbi:MAG: YhcN/YlaJ family sporulation lipoprotein [Firmicutes bacterium]|nr:YhcN/YlaJ family sporulation lipoprotein [Bacillota bacterium]